MTSLPATEDDYMYSSEENAMEDDSEVLEDPAEEEELATQEDYDFIEKPSEDFYCPVTFDLLQEPFLTACCGFHLSQEAVTRLQGQPCPVCKERNLNTMPDKYFKRRINEFEVRCPNKSLGCEWVGELGSLDRHLSQNSVEGECPFVTVACPYSCGDSFQRCQLDGHMAKDCRNRPFACQYCDHEATYIKVTNEHRLICKQFPLECPNKCGENAIERQHLPKHLEETCPLQVIKCEFSYAGCEAECQRQHMQTHLEENLKVHLNKVSCALAALQSKTERLQSTVDEQQKQIMTHLEENVKLHLNKVSHTLQCQTQQQQSIIEQQQKQIVALMSALNRVALVVQKPLVPIFVPPPDIVMINFEKHKKGDNWYSPPFYSHIGGYKMSLRVYANGTDSGEATHVSVFCYLNRGEYDDQLKWPFRGDITIQLLNQSRDEGHWEETLPYSDTSNDDTAGRVVGKERAKGWGYGQFIAHTELNTENKVYLKNDCLKFRISKIVVKSIWC